MDEGQFFYRDKSFILLRMWRSYKKFSALGKIKFMKGEYESLREPGKLLTYEQAVRLQNKEFNDSLRPFAPIAILAVIGYLLWVSPRLFR